MLDSPPNGGPPTAVSTPPESSPRVEGAGRIRPRARLLNSIGAELISSEIVAVIELVRNSYDADARNVEVAFAGIAGEGEVTLELRDDGHGMTRPILLGPWMEPATDWKSANAQTDLGGERSPGGRRRLGSKGVGRFASQRLGEHLELTTKHDSSADELVATFDWSELQRPDRYLDQLRIPWWEQAPTTVKTHGTVLRVTELRDSWDATRFERLRVALSRLVGPGLEAEEFRIHLSVEGLREEIRPLIDRSQAMYLLSGEVQEGGLAQITYRDLLGNEEHWERRVNWPAEVAEAAGPFRFRLGAWDLDREPLLHYLKVTESPLGLRDFRRSLRDHSGVSLYRDGFRILPYGESDNDWLRLDRRRINNPTMRLSNNQVLGAIELGADQNPALRDQTNREGLVTNGAYEHLRDIVVELTGYLENRRYVARRSAQEQWRSEGTRLPELGGGADKHIKALIRELNTGKATNAGTELQAALDERQQNFNDTLRLYAGLATTGQAVGLIFEQLRHAVRQMESEIKVLRSDLQWDISEFDEPTLSDVRWRADRVGEVCGDMIARMEKLDPLARVRRGRRLRRTPLDHCTCVVLEAYADLFAESAVQPEFEGDQWLELSTNADVVQQAIACILSNALDAVTLLPKGRRIRIRYHAEGITVGNNGPPIPKRVLPLIFEPHFTTRENAAGYGLTLARQLIEGINGRLTATTSGEWTEFRLQLAAQDS